MKLLVLCACSVAIGCAVIFGLVHGLVPHLVEPTLFPVAQAREHTSSPVADAITTAGSAVRTGVGNHTDVLVADSR